MSETKVPSVELCRSTDKNKAGGICGEAAAYSIHLKTHTADTTVPVCEEHWRKHNRLAAQRRSANRH